MALDSKSIPLFAGLLVLLVVGAFIVGRTVLGPPGQVQTGTAQLDAATLAEPQELHPQLEAGRASVREGRLDEARDLLAQVPESDVSYLLALNDLGIVLEKLGQPREALAAFNTILEHQPENPLAMYGLCHAQIALDDLSAAEMACLRVLEIDVTHSRARFALGLVRVGQDRLALGVDAYLRAVKQHTDENRIRQAALELDMFSQAHPDMAGPHYAMAVLARVLVSRETEREELDKYLQLAPNGIAAENARKKLAELAGMGF